MAPYSVTCAMARRWPRCSGLLAHEQDEPAPLLELDVGRARQQIVELAIGNGGGGCGYEQRRDDRAAAAEGAAGDGGADVRRLMRGEDARPAPSPARLGSISVASVRSARRRDDQVRSRPARFRPGRSSTRNPIAAPRGAADADDDAWRPAHRRASGLEDRPSDGRAHRCGLRQRDPSPSAGPIPRSVSGGSLLVASMPSLPPRPASARRSRDSRSACRSG